MKMAYNEGMGSQYNPTQNTNTTGLQFYSTESTMTVDFWNDAISIKIFPAKPESERTKKSIYDYKKGLSVVISRDDAVYLGKQIKDVLIPASDKKEEALRGIPSAKVNMFVISTGVKQFGELAPYCAIFRGINENRIPEESMLFKFSAHRVFSEYDKDTGNYKCSDEPNAELIILASFLESCNNLYGATYHSMRHGDRFARHREYEFRNAVGNKLGVAVQSTNTNYVNRQDTPDPWAGTGETTSTPTAPTSTVSDVDAIKGLL